jgi:threonine dehydrogenase-like Zn-dependent dehydrogenase
MARTPAPTLQSQLVEAIGASYAGTKTTPMAEAAKTHGPFDLIFEATGYSPLAFEAMEALGKNGVLVLSSVTGGEHTITINADAINLGFVLGNKVMVGTVNANREYFEMGVRDMAQAAIEYPAWLPRLLTHHVRGLDQYAEFMRLLTEAENSIKVYLEVAALPQ